MRLPRLQAMQIIGGLLHVAGGGEDSPLVLVFLQFVRVAGQRVLSV
jgi:hypothetical protein